MVSYKFLLVIPVGISVASLFMSLVRIEGLSKALELGRNPLVLFDSAMVQRKQQERGKRKERVNKKARVKWGEENERQMANNVNTREMSL